MPSTSLYIELKQVCISLLLPVSAMNEIRNVNHYDVLPMKFICVSLAALLLFCLAPMPYGYYQLVRLVSMVVFAIMAYQNYVKKQVEWAVVFGALALLFQPFVKIALGRAMWNIVDVAVGILLIIMWYKERGNTIR